MVLDNSDPADAGCGGVDMSPAAIERRLDSACQLSNLCLELATAGRSLLDARPSEGPRFGNDERPQDSPDDPDRLHHAG